MTLIVYLVFTLNFVVSWFTNLCPSCFSYTGLPSSFLRIKSKILKRVAISLHSNIETLHQCTISCRRNMFNYRLHTACRRSRALKISNIHIPVFMTSCKLALLIDYFPVKQKCFMINDFSEINEIATRSYIISVWRPSQNYICFLGQTNCGCNNLFPLSAGDI